MFSFTNHILNTKIIPTKLLVTLALWSCTIVKCPNAVFILYWLYCWDNWRTLVRRPAINKITIFFITKSRASTSPIHSTVLQWTHSAYELIPSVLSSQMAVTNNKTDSFKFILDLTPKCWYIIIFSFKFIGALTIRMELTRPHLLIALYQHQQLAKLPATYQTTSRVVRFWALPVLTIRMTLVEQE